MCANGLRQKIQIQMYMQQNLTLIVLHMSEKRCLVRGGNFILRYVYLDFHFVSQMLPFEGMYRPRDSIK